MDVYDGRKPIRLRTILVKHLTEINPKVNYDKIDALESDLVTYFRFFVYNAETLGCKITITNNIGDFE